MRIILKNKKARFNYHIEEKLEAGIVLAGSEIKSIRAGKINIGEAYITVKDQEVFLINCRISPYDQASIYNHDPLRDKKLLLNRREIQKLSKKIEKKGWTIIPLSVYINDKNIAKIEIGLCIGKKYHDKRESEKKKETEREIQKALKGKF